MEKIVVRILKGGKIKVDASGMRGRQCVEIVDEILGKATDRILTDGYYQTEREKMRDLEPDPTSKK